MAVQIKPQVEEGRTYFVEVGRFEFKWVIYQFQEFIELGQPIKSPSFKVRTSENGEKFETFHQVMDISNQTSMPISIVKETPGSVLVKMDLKSYQPNYYITLEPKSVFVGIGDESKGILTLKTGAYSSIQNIIPGELTINLDFSVRQTVERMV